MREKIALFLGEIGREFQKEFCSSLSKEATNKGYDLFIFNNFGFYDNTYLFDAGERDVINIPDFSDFAGVVAISDTFDIEGMESLLINRIKSQNDCPIVSIRNGSKDTYRVTFDDYRTTYEITNHLIKEHGFTNICFMSGPYSAEDSIKRLDGYKAAMKDAGLEVPQEAIFEGDFWKFRSKPAADQFLRAYSKCEAIVCANDYMALGLIEEFKKRGINAPQDIAITGFDEVLEGLVNDPPLTTVRVPIAQMARSAMEIIEDVNADKEVAMEKLIPGEVLYKGSCGCNMKMTEDLAVRFNQISDEYINIRNATFITSDIQNRITEDAKLAFIDYFCNVFSFPRSFLCLCTDDYKDDSTYSETMKLRAVFPLSDDANKTTIVNSTFKRELIIPEEAYDSSKPTSFIVLPIHRKNTTYGYLVTTWDEQSNYLVYLSPFKEALALAYDDLRMQDQYSEFLEIKRQTLIDPLTGIYNRRGFEQKLENLKTNKNLESDIVSFISADLDNLKTINDTYGHAEGDIAIKAFADALTHVISDGDIYARVGGDEFYIVLVSPDETLHKTFIQRTNEALACYNETASNDYNIHASIGICTISVSELDRAYDYINIADKNMYDSKKEYKQARGESAPR